MYTDNIKARKTLFNIATVRRDFSFDVGGGNVTEDRSIIVLHSHGQYLLSFAASHLLHVRSHSSWGLDLFLYYRPKPTILLTMRLENT